MFNFYTAA